MANPSRSRADALIVAGLALLGFVLELRAFWPGLMSVDSVEQYSQATLHRYNDHHPPVMAWVWSWTDRAIRGPGGMLALHLALLWAGLWAIAEGARRHGLRHAWLVLPVGVLPWVACIAGVVWKDVGMACALLAAGGVLYLAEDGGRRARLAAVAAALLLIAYATMVRANGPFAALPLVAYAFMVAFPRQKVAPSLAAAVVVVLVVLGSQQVFERRLLDASPRHLSQLVMLFDLAGIACRGAEIDIPAAFRKPSYDRGALCRAYDPDQVDTLLFFPASPLQRSFDAGAVAALRGEWLAAIRDHPGPYLAHRAHSFAGLLGLHRVSNDYRYLRQPYMQANPWGFVFTPNPLSSALDASVDALADSGLFSGALWIAVALALLAAIAALHLPARFETVLLVSGLANALPYFFFSLAPNYRFLWWTVLATTVALMLAVLRAVSPLARRPANAVPLPG